MHWMQWIHELIFLCRLVVHQQVVNLVTRLPFAIHVTLDELVNVKCAQASRQHLSIVTTARCKVI